MDRIDEMRVLVRAVEAGSFSAAARTLNITPSAVAKLVARLEARLGARLLNRSTRKLDLTPEGEAYYERAVVILSDVDEIEQAVAASRSEPRGRLRVSASAAFALRYLVPLVPEFQALHPALELELSLSDRVVDLLHDRFDLGIRIGPVHSDSLRTRKLAESRMVILASPGYLAAHGRPVLPKDLLQHECLIFEHQPNLNDWPFLQHGAVQRITVQGRLRATDGTMLRQLALADAGICRVSLYQTWEDMRDGRLVEVLSDFNPGDRQVINAVYSAQRHVPARLRAFIDFLVERLGNAPWPM